MIPERKLMKKAAIERTTKDVSIYWPSEKDVTQWIYNIRTLLRKEKREAVRVKLERIKTDLIIIKSLTL